MKIFQSILFRGMTIVLLTLFLALGLMSFKLNLKSSEKELVKPWWKTALVDAGGALGGAGTVHSLGSFIVKSDMSAGQQVHGLRYALNPNNFLGAEYISTNLGTTPSNLFNRRFTSLYAWMGQGGHAYYTKKVRKHNSTIRFGYVNFLRDHYFNNVNYSTIAQRVQNYYVNYVLAL